MPRDTARETARRKRLREAKRRGIKITPIKRVRGYWKKRNTRNSRKGCRKACGDFAARTSTSSASTLPPASAGDASGSTSANDEVFCNPPNPPASPKSADDASSVDPKSDKSDAEMETTSTLVQSSSQGSGTLLQSQSQGSSTSVERKSAATQTSNQPGTSHIGITATAASGVAAQTPHPGGTSAGPPDIPPGTFYHDSAINLP